MIQLTAAGKRFGHKLLFENLNWLSTPPTTSALSEATAPANPPSSKSSPAWTTSTTATCRSPATSHKTDSLSLSGNTAFHECMTVFDDVKDMEIEQPTGKMSDLDPVTRRQTSMPAPVQGVE